MSEDKVTNQLHQLLAVTNDLSNKASLITKETINTFTKKQDHFDGLIKSYASNNESDSDFIPPEIKEVVTSVADKIDYTSKAVIKAIDAEVSKEETNSSGEARAVLEVDGRRFGEFSAISFLALEKSLLTIRSMYQEIPTLDPTKSWQEDFDSPGHIYKTEEEVKARTAKVQRALTLAPPTDKHPAQVQLITEDVQVGKYHTVHKSGRITPADKSELLERIDSLILAVKEAKAKANQAQVKNTQVGGSIFDFINEGIL